MSIKKNTIWGEDIIIAMRSKNKNTIDKLEENHKTGNNDQLSEPLRVIILHCNTNSFIYIYEIRMADCWVPGRTKLKNEVWSKYGVRRME